MTSKQLERKAKQLAYRRRLAESIESLEENIKAYLHAGGKIQAETESFAIRLEGNNLSVKLLPRIDPRQLKLIYGRNP